MTDKSSKLSIMKREDFRKLGKIRHEELLKIEKIMNLHTLSWVKMWRTGQDHEHQDRIQ